MTHKELVLIRAAATTVKESTYWGVIPPSVSSMHVPVFYVHMPYADMVIDETGYQPDLYVHDPDLYVHDGVALWYFNNEVEEG